MSQKAIHLRDLHAEHKLWLNEIHLYDEEIGTFENRLGEVVSKNTKTEVLANLEHFQNSLIRHKQVALDLRRTIEKHEQDLAKFAEENQVAINRKHFEDHPSLREDVVMERKLFGELKEELKTFLAKVY